MLRWIVESSLKLRFLVLVLAAVMIVLGITRLGSAPVDVLPEFAPPYLEIQTEALGLSTIEVESLVTLNLEELLHGTPWLRTIRSRSVPGLSSLTLIFEPGTDVLRARQLVQERLILTHMLPNVSKPPVMLQPLSATSRVMVVGLSSNRLSPIEMSVLAHWKIRPALLGVPGVANVAVWGERDRQLQVLVDPERLRAHGVSLDQIIKTTGDALWVSPLTFLNASTPGTGGWIDTPNQRLEVRHVLPISSPEDLARVVVDGTTLPLGAVADVVEHHPPLIGDALLKDGPGLLLVVEKFPGSNTLEVTRGVEGAISKLQPGLSGITFDTTIFRPASYIERSIANLSWALIVGS
ncbi:MAG TPA: efflux RND transporter permease subunit, partial [Chloroflexota bacterium]|nr:efflux RND transporter permease subunit [Chloroflexota bacterium]